MTVFHRRLPRFGYVRPSSLDEAFAALDPGLPVTGQVFAGGTDLVPKLRSRELPAPPRVIDLKGIAGLDALEWQPDGALRVGALVTAREVATSPAVRERYPALAQGAHAIGSDQVANRGTIAGNVVSALPSADAAPALLVHGASVVCAMPAGERAVELDAFFREAGEPALEPGELVRELRLPPPEPGERSVYLKLAPRGRMDLAVVGAAASLVLADGGVRRARIALGSAGPVPVRAPEAEAALAGRELTPDAIEEAARLAAGAARPRSSHRASAEYRRLMLEVLVRRALEALAGPQTTNGGNGR